MAKKLVVFDEEERYLYDIVAVMDEINLISATNASDAATAATLANEIKATLNKLLTLLGAVASSG